MKKYKDKRLKRGLKKDRTIPCQENLNDVFDRAINNEEIRYIAVQLRINKCEALETVIIERENFNFKKTYFNNIYDENLKHKKAPVNIVNYTFGNTFSELKTDLFL